MLNTMYAPHIGGGAEIIVQEHAGALQRAGVEVAVLCLGPDPGLRREMVDGVTVWRAGIRNLYFPHGKRHPAAWQRTLWHALDIYNPLVKKYVSRVVQAERPDVASCHNISGWSIAVWDELVAQKVPIVQVLHDQYLLCPKTTMFADNSCCQSQCTVCAMMRFPHREKSSAVTSVVGVSDFILQKLLRNGYFARTPFKRHIHNTRQFPFDPAALQPRKPDDQIVFGFIGSLAPNKGIDVLLQTFCREARDSWRLLVAGAGKEEYERHLKSRYSDARISYLGHCEPASFFPAIDATITPSMWEDTFPGVVFESMLFGVPVIGSDRGGIPEMITPGETGILFNPEETASLVGAMGQLEDSIDFFRASRGEIIGKAAAFRNRELWNDQWLETYRQAMRPR
ncbi:glycosyltransferase family 4 protein [Geomonas sp. RF6]|uniref:glycosyltransferase family 4 protein n=1 Tax=Geomonas sp. RF6 TaxID=2897342 RepID=UPI001E298DE9|nr:glycosyltransferase family 4 protein [Geomonas sp. RF6]UFS69770.1 glycosyltransferase family 4 protein [Geomonas sp. RF6]